jgi:hypothetical protein
MFRTRTLRSVLIAASLSLAAILSTVASALAGSGGASFP